ncbi:MAG: hypothetical protein ACR2MU_03100 [Gaiellaceae bacterium]
MRRLLGLVAAAGAMLAAGVAPASSSAPTTSECAGLPVCVPVAGPWVLVPVGSAVPRPHVEFQLSCPRGYVVGGVDVELSERAIDVAFLGRSGSPVNPGITTARDAVFLGTYVGGAGAAPSFRPHVGCLPASGGGARVPAAAKAFAPGQPTVRRVKTAHVLPGVRTVAQGCVASERLVAATHALGFYTPAAPTRDLASSVSATQAVRGEGIAVTVRARAAVRGVRAIVQVEAVCAGGR